MEVRADSGLSGPEVLLEVVLLLLLPAALACVLGWRADFISELKLLVAAIYVMSLSSFPNFPHCYICYPLRRALSSEHLIAPARNCRKGS